MSEQLRAEFEELCNQIEALRMIASGKNTGMGANIVIEKAGRLPGQIRRLRRLVEALSPSGPEEAQR